MCDAVENILCQSQEPNPESSILAWFRNPAENEIRTGAAGFFLHMILLCSIAF
jgi:hypothetical protein